MLTPTLFPSDPGVLALATGRAREYISQSKAEATIRAYRSDWRHFESWCRQRGLVELPATPETIALYLAEHGGILKPATLQRRLAAIAKAHSAAGCESPTGMRHAAVSETWKGLKRVHGTAQTAKAALVTVDLRRLLQRLPEGILGIRDRALLLVGFAGAFRRSELVSLGVDDCEFTSDGLVITLRRSKTDQDGAGRKIGIPYGSNPETCPVRSLRAWLDAAMITTGPLFVPVTRHGHLGTRALSSAAVALVVKRYAAAAGLERFRYAGHSLRAGLATSAAAAGVPDHAIARQTGHRSLTILHRYIREGSLFKNNAAASVGL